MAADAEAKEAKEAKALSALLGGIAQRLYHNNSAVTEALLREQLYPDMEPEHFRSLHDRMRGLLKSMASADMEPQQLEVFLAAQSRKQGGATPEQAAALSRFWKSQRGRVRESLQARSRWELSLRRLTWRLDLQAAAANGPNATNAANGPNGPVALMELELGREGEDSEFVCVELDEAKVNQVLKKMADIQESIDAIARRT